MNDSRNTKERCRSMKRIESYESATDKGIFLPGREVSNIYWSVDEIRRMAARKSLFLEEIPAGKLWLYCTKNRNQVFFQIDKSGINNIQADDLQLHNCVSEIIFTENQKEKKEEEREVLRQLGFAWNGNALMMACTKEDSVCCPDYKQIQCRKAIVEDFDFIHELNEACFDRLTDAIPDRAELLEDINNGRITIIGNERGKITGSVLVQKYNRRRLIRHLAVMPASRNQGFGTALVKAAVKDMQQGERSMLWVREKNEAAINMYKRSGFKYQGRQMEIWVKK